MLSTSDGLAERCFECDQPAEHRHHVVPRSKGGKRTIPLCHACHDLVHFRVDDTGSLLRHAHLRAYVAAKDSLRETQEPEAEPVPAVAAVVSAERPPAPEGMTWLPGWPRPVYRRDLEITPETIRDAELMDSAPAEWAELRAKIRSRPRPG